MLLLHNVGGLLSLLTKLVVIPLGYATLFLLLMSGLRRSYLFQQIKFTIDNIWNLKWWPIEKERLKHIQLIGATGAGKTTVLQCLIDRSIRDDIGFLLIDSRGSLPERVLSNKRFSLNHWSKRHKSLVYLDFEKNPPAFNILCLPSKGNSLEKQTNAEVLAEELTEALSINMRPKPNEAQKNLLKNLLVVGIYGENVSLMNVLHWLGSSNTARHEELFTIIEQIPSEPLKRYFTEDFHSTLLNKTKEALRNRLSSLVTPVQLYQSLCSRHCEVDFGKILKEGKFVIVKASSSILGNYPARTVSNIVLSLLYFQGFKRLSESGAVKPYHVYIDELEYFANQSLVQSLKSSRQTGISYCLSYQELNQSGIDLNLQKTINREAAVKIIGQLRADEQKAATDLIGLDNNRAFEDLSTGRFWIKAGRKRPFQMRFPSKFAVHSSQFGKWWKGRAFMNRTQLLKLKSVFQIKNDERHYQWPHKQQKKLKPQFSNFSPHGIPME